PDYMVPSSFVRLDALPLTQNGKTDRNALPAPSTREETHEPTLAPRYATEARIAAVWQTVLRTGAIGLSDNFFEVGGHSLLAVQAVDALQQWGIEVSLADFFTHPTVQSLAAHLESAQGVRTDHVAFRAAGEDRPLFLVHESSGEVFYGLELTRHLGAGIPVHGLPAEPLDDEPSTTVQAMAARLVRIMRSVQPHGPYRVAGWSFGGTVAYEIAAQLLGEDETVEFLGLIDTRHPTATSGTAPAPADLSDNDFLLLALSWYHASPTDIEQLRPSAAALDFPALLRECQERQLLPAHLSSSYVRHFLRRWRAHSTAERDYWPQPLPLAVDLFVAADEAPTDRASSDQSLGWHTVVPPDLLVTHPIPGTHTSVVEPPHVHTLGASLTARLAETGDTATPAARPPAPRPAPMVWIQTGTTGVTPVVAVPGAGDNAAAFVELAQALGPRRPLLAFQPRGTDGRALPHTTVAAAARSYASVVEQRHPGEAVHLLGHSFGGWVALEAARLLTKAGRRVESLTLLDSEPPTDGHATRGDVTRADVLATLLELYERRAGGPLGILPEDLEGLDEPAQIQLLHAKLVPHGLAPARSTPEDLAGVVRTFAAARRASYRPGEGYEGPVALFLAEDDLEAAQGSGGTGLHTGWRQWLPDMTVHVVPGNHVTMLRAPHVDRLAAHIAKYL
ncbi:alpha/beta fold hydrolase, partial [Streptomyces sp. NPDC056373]|uniref:alpha/beta fold hydrolase n=1 Tax=Streptomyces sp. NPDC056373 TaxID=3345798 RepID=UPI0035DE15EF